MAQSKLKTYLLKQLREQYEELSCIDKENCEEAYFAQQNKILEIREALEEYEDMVET